METNTAAKLSVEEILKKQNLTIDDLIKCGREGLGAVKTRSSKYGDIEEADYNVRHKFFASFMELLGYMKKDSVSVQVVNVSPAERELLEAYRRVPTGPSSSSS